jgi:hypothetical protein
MLPLFLLIWSAQAQSFEKTIWFLGFGTEKSESDKKVD